MTMGWILSVAGLFLLGLLVRNSVDRQTVKSLGFLLKILALVFGLVLIGAIFSTT
jgi:uncharacterized membrane protein